MFASLMLLNFFLQVTDEDIKVFEDLLPSRVVTDPDEIAPHNIDWIKMVRYDP